MGDEQQPVSLRSSTDSFDRGDRAYLDLTERFPARWASFLWAGVKLLPGEFGGQVLPIPSLSFPYFDLGEPPIRGKRHLQHRREDLACLNRPGNRARIERMN